MHSAILHLAFTENTCDLHWSWVRATNQPSLPLLADTEVVEKPTKEETVVENATPDYAAGLVSTQVATEICTVCVYMCADMYACMNGYVC